MAAWELGDITAIILAPLAWLLRPVWRCHCEQRREWLNEAGESFYRRWWPTSYAATRLWFQRVVLFWLNRRPMAESHLHAIVRQGGIRISRRGMQRWLDDLPVTYFVQSGERWYGLPSDS